MIHTRTGSRLVGAIAALAVMALLLVPFLYTRYTSQLRGRITATLEPARQAVSLVEVDLARQIAAIRGLLLTADSSLVDEYSEATEEQVVALRALRRLAEGQEGEPWVSAAQELEQRALLWNALNHQLLDGRVSPDSFIAELPRQQARYREALRAVTGLEQKLSGGMSDLRSAISRAERRWSLAMVILTLVAAACVVLIIVTLHLTRKHSTLANTDPLTGLLNRRGFLKAAERELSRASRSQSVTTLIAFDLDGFKLLNDREGHDAGDRALISVAEGIRGTVRKVDAAGRVGGDEFLVLLADNRATPSSAAVNRVREAITSRLARDGWPLTLSVGAVNAGEGEDLEALLRQADELMYAAKRAGKNRMAARDVA